MFTGIVEEVGTVHRVLSGSRAGSIAVNARTVLEGTRVGDSIAVNGVCLTVTQLSEGQFCADVMPATLRATGLGALKAGDPVDLERAMPADGRFGGHIVSGHIDGVGTIKEVREDQNAHIITVAAPAEILNLIVEKGSIAIDGVSLTVVDVLPQAFTVSIIPHTGEETVLLKKRPGAVVNLENDIVGKYVRKLLHGFNAKGSVEGRPSRCGGLSAEFLQANGFI